MRPRGDRIVKLAISAALPVALATALGACAASGAQGGWSSPPGGASTPPVASAPVPTPTPPPSTNNSAAAASGSALPEAPTTDANSSGAVSGGAGATTPDERVAVLDKRLSDSLGAFDQTLKQEQQRVAQERDARAAQVEVIKEGGEDEEFGAADSSGSAERDKSSGDASGSRPGDLKSEKERTARREAEQRRAGTESAGGSGGSGANARNIPDGSDDDIVAKRLRRAAEQETDPELKEKLWEKYREYKRGTRSSGE